MIDYQQRIVDLAEPAARWWQPAGLLLRWIPQGFIARDPQFDGSFRVPAHRAALDLAGQAFNAIDPDLKRFHARSGKLILMTGSIDASVSPRDTDAYYQAVVRSLGPAAADRTVELSVAPGE